MPHTLPKPIPDLTAQFHDRGFVILRDYFPQSVVAAAREEMKTLVDEQARSLFRSGSITDLLENEPFETRLYKLYEGHTEDVEGSWRAVLHLEGMHDIFFDEGILDLVEALIGGEIRLYPNYTVRPKLPDHPETLVLWHQDGGYTEHWHKHGHGDVSDLRMVNTWTPLVPARVENGCMQFVPGTHGMPLFRHEQREHYLEIPSELIEPHSDQFVDMEVDPGDVIIFHNMLCHRGLPNHSQTIRWSVDWRYQDASQPTLRPQEGHLARSREDPSRSVKSATEWANLSFQ